MNRRSFLAQLGTLGVLGGCSSLRRFPRIPSMEQEWLLSSFVTKDPSGKLSSFLLASLPDNQVIHRIPINNSGHCALAHPHDPNRILVLPHGSESAMVTLPQAGKSSAISYLRSYPGYHFYGHGAFAEDGATFFTTEKKLGGGKLVVRDSSSLAVQQAFDLPGLGPHDCHLMHGGKVMAVAMDGGTVLKDQYSRKTAVSVILFLDTSNGKVLGRSHCDDDLLGFGHIALSSLGIMAVASMNYPRDNERGSSFIVVGRPGEKLQDVKVPLSLGMRLTTQALSLVIDEKRDFLVATYPADNLVIRYNLSRREYADHIELPIPHGVGLSHDASRYIVSSKNGFLYHLSADRLQVIASSPPATQGSFDAHLELNLLPRTERG